jgi:hypothetical protein
MFGASPQLECWNPSYWRDWKDEVTRLGYCNAGLTAIIVLTTNLEMVNIL